MSGIRLEGSDGTQIGGDSTALALKVNLPTTATQAGYAKLASKEGFGIKSTVFGYPCVSIENLEFLDGVDGAALNTNLWTTSASTMTVTQASSLINVNATASTTASTYAILQTIQTFYVTSCLPLHFHFTMQASLWNLPVNTVAEIGWMTCATNAAPTDGVFIRVIAGAWSLIANNTGSEQTVALGTLPTINSQADFVLDVHGDSARLYMEATPGAGSVFLAEVDMNVAWGAITNSNRQPFVARVYNTSTIPAASPTLKLGQVSIQQRNAAFYKPYADKLAGIGRGGYQSPVTTFAQTANHANSTSPTSATLSNTTAGYTTLGGRFQFAAPLGAATDFALFGFQVPVGYQLYVKGVYIDSVNTGAAVATTATMLDWSVGVNASAVSLATADGAGTWAPRRIPVGVQSWIVAAGIGAPAEAIKRSFQIPAVVEGGRFFHVIVQVPIGTATASQVIRGDVFVNCYFE